MARHRGSPVIVATSLAVVVASGLTVLWQWAEARSTFDAEPTIAAPADPSIALSTPCCRRAVRPGVLARRLNLDDFADEFDDVAEAVERTSCLAVSVDGQLVVGQNNSVAVIPASTMKLVVAAAALEMLGPGYRFTTSVSGEVGAEGVVEGDLTLVGGGDPVLSTDWWPTAERQLHPPINVTRLEDLADAVVTAGVTRVAGRIVGDGSRYDDEFFAPSWTDDVRVYEAGPYDALLVNDGWTTMSIDDVADDPALGAAELFAGLLRERGVRVGGGVAAQTLPFTAEIASVQSQNLSAIVHEMLMTSDDNTAEMLVKEIGFEVSGSGSTTAGLEAIIGQLLTWGVSIDNLLLVDGSGLSRDNRATCDTVLGILQQHEPDDAFGAALPVAAVSGTLVDFFGGSAVDGRMQAKTGTLTDVKALAGYLPVDSGGTIEFVLVQNSPGIELGGFLTGVGRPGHSDGHLPGSRHRGRARPAVMDLEMRYDSIGRGHARARTPDRSLAALVVDSLGAAATVLNVGAGTGNYEPADRRVVAVEPSAVMIAQRAEGSGPAVRGVAADLPFVDMSFDACMALSTIHHSKWRGSRRVGFPAVVDLPINQPAPTAERVAECLGGNITVLTFEVPADFAEGSAGAFWNRPEAYCDPSVQASLSMFALGRPAQPSASPPQPRCRLQDRDVVRRVTCRTAVSKHGRADHPGSIVMGVTRLEPNERAGLPDRAFAYVDSSGRRRLPIHDAGTRPQCARSLRPGRRSRTSGARDRARMRLLNAAKKFKIVPIGFIAGQLQSERSLGRPLPSQRPRCPSGFVTMLMTDIEGSTALVHRSGAALPRGHRRGVGDPSPIGHRRRRARGRGAGRRVLRGVRGTPCGGRCGSRRAARTARAHVGRRRWTCECGSASTAATRHPPSRTTSAWTSTPRRRDLLGRPRRPGRRVGQHAGGGHGLGARRRALQGARQPSPARAARHGAAVPGSGQGPADTLSPPEDVAAAVGQLDMR